MKIFSKTLIVLIKFYQLVTFPYIEITADIFQLVQTISLNL